MMLMMELPYGWKPALLMGGLLLVVLGVWLRSRHLSLDQRLAWAQWALLVLPWGLWLGLVLAGIPVPLTGMVLLLLGTLLGYVAVASWRQRLVVPPAPEVTPPTTTQPFASLAEVQDVLGWDQFLATEWHPCRAGVVVRGNLRCDPAQAHQALTAKLQSRWGNDYCLFLMRDEQDRPVVVILPAAAVAPEPVPWLPGLSLGLLAVAAVTCWQVVPLWGLGLVGVLLAHEAGHRWQARRYGVGLRWPLWVPGVELGCFGAVTPLATVVPHRTALWDIAAAGPAVGAGVSLVLVLVGLGLSAAGQGTLLEPERLQESVLVAALARLVLGDQLHHPLIPVHPLVTVGWLGLVVTALHLLPVGCLDGGSMVQAVYGEKVLRATTWVSAVVLGLVGLGQPMLLVWGVLLVLVQRQPERPALEALSEPDDLRVWLTWGALLGALLVLLPWRDALGWAA